MNMTILMMGSGLLSVTALLVALLVQRRQCRLLQQQLVAVQTQPATPVPEPVEETPQPFAADLDRAERSRREPRPHRNETADRYRHISAMARQGMEPAQIAAALQIGEAEAAQIVRLARLG